jgi:NAD(P)-dependent dehydrogenase (short-subunit alcohol dehydrogenase family)
VTGAGGGIGRATAHAFAQAGSDVAIADVSEQSVQETARLVEKAGGRVLALQCDVRRSEEVKAALDQVVDAFGP